MAEEHKINPTTGNLDKIGQTDSDVTENDGRYLKLDQTVAQTVTKGTPTFANGIIIKAGQRLYFDGN